MLKITNLKVVAGEKEILSGVNLTLLDGQIHALMGQNGSGKSTLAHVIMGNPIFKVLDGEILLDGKSALGLDPNERSKRGVFLSFQTPHEIPRLKVSSFLRTIYNNSHNEKLSPAAFRSFIKEKSETLDIKDELLGRYLNEGFSGGEKKKMEILQMLILEPKLVILEEIDSGLDVDALLDIAKAVNNLHKKGTSFLVITHYARILKYIVPDFVHLMKEGTIVESGTKEFSEKLESEGYKSYEKK